ncbi:MAG: hypothetical protein Q9224_004162 [Gallowayella concinna]
MSPRGSSAEAGPTVVCLLEALAHTYRAYEADNIICPNSVIELIQEQLDTLYVLSEHRGTEDVQVVADDMEDLADLADLLGCRQREGHAQETCSFRILHKMIDDRVDDMRALNAEVGAARDHRDYDEADDASEEEVLMSPLRNMAETLKREREGRTEK